MPVYLLNDEPVFPPADMAEQDGLLAIGGDLSVERLLVAYRNGIFPWYSEDPILWWCPDPRFVLFPGELKISRSMQALMKKKTYTFTVNKAFAEVIGRCKTISRKEQDGTWITDDVRKAYINLHELGYAYSAEAWLNGKLAGGLYGIKLGTTFFGESMFSNQSNASKFAFICYVNELKKEGIRLIDCQVYTEHLESLGARMIPRKEFLRLIS